MAGELVVERHELAGELFTAFVDEQIAVLGEVVRAHGVEFTLDLGDQGISGRATFNHEGVRTQIFDQSFNHRVLDHIHLRLRFV